MSTFWPMALGSQLPEGAGLPSAVRGGRAASGQVVSPPWPGPPARPRPPPWPSSATRPRQLERPAPEVRRVDDERVVLPLANRIAVVRGLDVGLVRTAVDRDDARDAHELGDHHEPFRVLNPLHGIRAEEPRRKAGRPAERARL